jgi:hypothetical protein
VRALMTVFTILCAAWGPTAFAAGSLTGWGPFRFGMTLSQAQKVAPSFLEFVNPGRYIYKTIIHNREFFANLYFNGANDTLDGFILQSFGNGENDAQCSSVMQAISEELTQKYGPPVSKDRNGFSGLREHLETFNFKDGKSIEFLTNYGCQITIKYFLPRPETPRSGL